MSTSAKKATADLAAEVQRLKAALKKAEADRDFYKHTADVMTDCYNSALKSIDNLTETNKTLTGVNNSFLDTFKPIKADNILLQICQN